MDVLLARQAAELDCAGHAALDLSRPAALDARAEGDLGPDRALEELVVRVLEGVADSPRQLGDRLA